MAEKIALSIEIESSSLKELNDEIKKQTKILKENFKVGEEGYEEQAKLVAALKAEEKKHKDELRDKQKTYADVAKTGVGSYKALNKELIDLRKAFKNLSKAEREGAIGQNMTKRIQALDTELKGIDASIGQHQRNVGNYGSVWDSVGGKLKGGIGAFGEVASSMGGAGSAVGGFATELAGVAGPIGIVIAAVGALSMAVQGLVSEALEKFGELNKTIAKTGDLTDEQVVRMSAKVSTLSDIFGEENDEIVKAAQQMSKGFGISFEDALKQVEKGFKNGANASGEFIDSIKEYSALAKDAGMTAQEYTKLLESQAAEGVFSDKLADSMKEANIKLREFKKGTKEALEQTLGKEFADGIAKGVSSGTLTTIDAMQQISVKAKEVGLNNKQLSELTTNVFGTMAEDIGTSKILDIYASYDKKTRVLTGSAKKAQDAMEAQMRSTEALAKSQAQLAQTVAPLQQELDTFFAEMKTGTIDSLNAFLELYGQDITRIFKDIINFVTEIGKQFGEEFGEMFDMIKDIGVDIGTILNDLGITGGSTLDLIKSAVSLMSEPLKFVVATIKEIIELARTATDQFIDLAAQTGNRTFKDLKAQRELNEELEKEQENRQRNEDLVEEYKTRIRQQLDEETKTKENLAKIEKLTLEDIQKIDEARYSNRAFQEGRITNEQATQRAIGNFIFENLKRIDNKNKDINKTLNAQSGANNKLSKEEQERIKNATKILKAYNDAKASLEKLEGTITVDSTLGELAEYEKRQKAFKDIEKTYLALTRNLKTTPIASLDLDRQLLEGQLQQGLTAEVQKRVDEALLDTVKKVEKKKYPTFNLFGKIIEFEDEKELQEFMQKYQIVQQAIVDTTQLTSDTLFDITSSRIDSLEEKRMASIDRMFNREVEQARGNSVLIEQAEAKRIKRQEVLEAQMAKKRKRLAIAQATVNGAIAITNVLADPTVLAFAKPFVIGATVASTAAQIATISAQQFAKGGVINGPSHAQGGVPVYGAGGKFAEVEGGEAIINKRSTAMFKPVLSAINVAGGGKKFAQGGLMPSMERIAENAGFDINAETNLVSQAIAKLTDRQPVVVLDTFAEEQNKLDNYNKTKVQ